MSYLTQTTLAVDETTGIIDTLRSRFPHINGPDADDICYASTNRQNAVAAIAAETDLVLVVGSVNSSNSVRLVELSRRLGTPAHLIDDVHSIEEAWLHDARTIGLSAGASAPHHLLQQIIDYLASLVPITVEERVVATETIQFGLPGRLRPT